MGKWVLCLRELAMNLWNLMSVKFIVLLLLNFNDIMTFSILNLLTFAYILYFYKGNACDELLNDFMTSRIKDQRMNKQGYICSYDPWLRLEIMYDPIKMIISLSILTKSTSSWAHWKGNFKLYKLGILSFTKFVRHSEKCLNGWSYLLGQTRAQDSKLISYTASVVTN